MRIELVKSSITGVVQFFVSTLLVFITIPIFVKFLGVEAYGVYSLVALIGSLNTFANLGLNSSLVRYLAEQGKTKESDLDILVTFIILSVVIVPLIICGLIFKNFVLLHILNVPPHVFDDAEWLYFAMLICNILFLLGQTFTAILDSQQKIYLTNVYQMVYNVINSSLLLTVVLLGYPLKYIAIPILISAVVWFCIIAVMSLRSWGKLSVAGLRSSGIRIAKKHLSYGTKIYVSGLVLFMYEPFTKILVSHFIGAAAVGVLEIGLRVRNQIYGFMAKLLYPLFPFISKLTDRSKIRNIVHDVEQKVFFVVMPLAGIIILISKPLVGLFFHSNVDAIAITIACLVSVYMIASITVTPLFQFLTVKGFVSITIYIQGINVLVNTVVFLSLYTWFGYYAVVVANSIAILTSFSVLIYLQKKYLNSIIFDSIRQFIVVIGTFAASLLIGYLINITVRESGWSILLVPVAIISFTLISYRMFGLINKDDVVRYLGERNNFSKIATWALCNR